MRCCGHRHDHQLLVSSNKPASWLCQCRMDGTDKGTAHRWLLGTNETRVGRRTSSTSTQALVCGCALIAIRKPVPYTVPMVASLLLFGFRLLCALLQRRKRPIGDVVVGVIARVSAPAASMSHPSASLPLIRRWAVQGLRDPA